jgi:small subunit ribosomal protein S16
MFFLSSLNLIPRMFEPYFTSPRGPPSLRLQVFGTRARRFYRLVACHQRDPRDGKHMEVLGTFCPRVREGVKEVRLRFSRVKFWLAVGARLTPSVTRVLADAGLIPHPPPLHGWRHQHHVDSVACETQRMDTLHAEARSQLELYGKKQKGVY